jgi:hypothetical protein
MVLLCNITSVINCCFPQGLSSLLAEGSLAALPSLSFPEHPPLAPWVINPRRAAAAGPQQQLLQQAGLANGSSCSSSRLPKQLLAGRFCHHATFRGHGFPVFSLLYDKTGQRIITGADDANIKVRDVTTCYSMLLRTEAPGPLVTTALMFYALGSNGGSSGGCRPGCCC